VSSQSLTKAQTYLAANIKLARDTLGLTQEELAFRAGIDRTYASQIERGIANPSLAVICALADALDCPYQDLLKVQKS
jgi:transcriptional regulator with XRE-family HTH domain